MAHDVGILELRERRLGEHFERFTGGIGEQVEMDAIGDRFGLRSLWRTGGINHGRKLATSSGTETLPDPSHSRGDPAQQIAISAQGWGQRA